jgi:hypothetical protein
MPDTNISIAQSILLASIILSAAYLIANVIKIQNANN